MMYTIRKRSRSVTSVTLARSSSWAAVLLALLGTGCDGGGGDVGPNPTAARVVLNPDGLTLLVGGQGTLTAEVRDANDAVLSNAAVTWSSVDPAIATVTGTGTVTGHVVGQTQVIAAAGDKADSANVLVIDQLTLEVVPSAASVVVGNTTAFTVIARNAAGQVIPAPPVTWASSNTAVGTIDAGGVATGVAPGQTGITASAGTVSSAPATLTVTNEQAAACDGIQAVPSWKVSLSFSYQATKVNGVNHEIRANQSGDITATLTALGPLGFVREWTGSLAGTVSVDDSDKDVETSSTTTLKGSGQPTAPAATNEFALDVDPDACTYTFRLAAAITATATDPNGSFTGPFAVAVIQGDSPSPLGTWRQLGLANFDAQFDAHSSAAMDSFAGQDVYLPYGYGLLLWNPPTTDPIGSATVNYAITAQF